MTILEVEGSNSQTYVGEVVERDEDRVKLETYLRMETKYGSHEVMLHYVKARRGVTNFPTRLELGIINMNLGNAVSWKEYHDLDDIVASHKIGPLE